MGGLRDFLIELEAVFLVSDSFLADVARPLWDSRLFQGDLWIRAEFILANGLHAFRVILGKRLDLETNIKKVDVKERLSLLLMLQIKCRSLCRLASLDFDGDVFVDFVFIVGQFVQAGLDR